YYGNNYIAGAGGNDMIFDELGNGTVQGGGSIDYVSHPYVSTTGFTSFGSASSCTTGGHPGKTSVLWRVGACRDATGALLLNPSVDRPTDAGSYIEGSGGDNVIFGNGGQNDIVGGSSDFFGTGGACPASNEVSGAAGTCKRPSGSNLIFTGSGTQLDRQGYGDLSAQGHARNSSVVVAQTGEIIRIVGTNGTYGAANGGARMDATGFARFNYDSYTDTLPLAQQAHIVVRGVRLLDYTPGGPDLAKQAGPLVSGDIGGHPLPANAAYGIAAGTLQQGSEIHAESGDAFIYGGPADDVIFGGEQTATIITGYGDNGVSGGRGDACIIGGGGRCLTSRDSASYGEQLYGIAAIPSANISQLITTRRSVQQAVINSSGALKYTAMLVPYNWDPSAAGTASFATGCKENQTCPHYQPRFGHNIIY